MQVNIDIDQVRGLVKERNALYKALREIVTQADANVCTSDLVVIRADSIAAAREVLREVNDETL
jgi:hypothetical protein